jgi:hypothetical protein
VQVALALATQVSSWAQAARAAAYRRQVLEALVDMVVLAEVVIQLLLSTALLTSTC